MTFEEFATQNIIAMKSKEPTPQNMRDVALLELWLASRNGNDVLIENTPKAEPKTGTIAVLPSYFQYVEAKRKYQAKEGTKEKIIDSLSSVSSELKDLLKVIYRNADISEERQIITNFINETKF